MKQHNGKDENSIEVKETAVIKMNVKGTKSLLPKKQVAEGKVKGMRS